MSLGRSRKKLPGMMAAVAILFAFTAAGGGETRRDTAYFDHLVKELRSRLGAEKYAEAMTLAVEFEESTRETYGPDTIEHAAGLNWVGSIHQLLGNVDEAGPRFERVLAIYEEKLPADHPDLARALNNLGIQRHWLKNYEDAVTLHLRSLGIRERIKEPCQIAESLNNLGHTYPFLKRDLDALPLLERGLTLALKNADACPNLAVQILQNQATVLENLKRFDVAERALKQAIAASTKREGHQSSLAALNGRLGVANTLQGRCDAAAPYYQSALQLYRAIAVPPPLPLASALHDYAQNEIDCRRYTTANSLLDEAFDIRRRTLGPSHPDVGRTLSDLAEVARAQGRNDDAMTLIDSAAAIAVKLPEKQLDWIRVLFSRQVDIAWTTYSAADSSEKGSILSGAFTAAQNAMLKRTAATIDRAAERLSARNPTAGRLIREWENLRNRREVVGRRLTELYSRSSGLSGTDNEPTAELDTIDKKLRIVLADLQQTDSGVAALVDPKPTPLDSVRNALAADEALIVLLPGIEALHVFVTTSEGTSWKRQDLSKHDLSSLVRAVRIGLDDSMPRQKGESQAFNTSAARNLYHQLFDGVEEAFRSKPHLLISSAGQIDTIPLHVLITDHGPAKQPPSHPATTADYKSIAWMARRHAITMLPSVSNLTSLRSAGGAHAAKPFLAFANPALDGDSKNPTDADRAAQAKAWVSCSKVLADQTPAAIAMRGVRPVAASRGLVPSSRLLTQPPLPETAEEVCRVAASVKADEASVYLAARTSESALKDLSTTGELKQYRVLQFATHAAVAGEIDASAEPGLILTPPANPTEANDGYLSRSEIFQLDLNADWVVLSACNTAAPDTAGAEGLSGLAQAFFHAGARAMLVSHWYVDSDATKQLVIEAFRQLEALPGIGQAEALRRAMLAYLDQSEPAFAAPSYWSAFIVVGGGKRG